MPLTAPQRLTPEGPLPVVRRLLPDRAAAAARPRDAGVVAQHVHLAVLLDRAPGQRFDGLRPRDVGDDAEHFVLLLPQARDGGFQRRSLHVGEHDLHALLREARRQRIADAARCAGYHRHLALEVLHAAIRSVPPGTLRWRPLAGVWGPPQVRCRE